MKGGGKASREGHQRSGPALAPDSLTQTLPLSSLTALCHILLPENSPVCLPSGDFSYHSFIPNTTWKMALTLTVIELSEEMDWRAHRMLPDT